MSYKVKYHICHWKYKKTLMDVSFCTGQLPPITAHSPRANPGAFDFEKFWSNSSLQYSPKIMHAQEVAQEVTSPTANRK